MTGRRSTQPRGSDRGNAAVEFGLWLPLVLFALTCCLQLMSTLYDERAAHQAAQAGLIAQEAGSDPVQAVRAALAGRGSEAVVTAQDGDVRVQMPVRTFLPWLPAAVSTVSADARSGS